VIQLIRNGARVKHFNIEWRLILWFRDYESSYFICNFEAHMWTIVGSVAMCPVLWSPYRWRALLFGYCIWYISDAYWESIRRLNFILKKYNCMIFSLSLLSILLIFILFFLRNLLYLYFCLYFFVVLKMLLLFVLCLFSLGLTSIFFCFWILVQRLYFEY
jgi:hypothetical protein